MSSKITIEEHEVCSVELDTGPSNGISRNKCVVCKGRSMCGISPCPVLSSIELKFEDGVISRDIISGKSNGLNIGWERYPNDTIYASVLSNDYSPNVRFEDGREHVFYRLSNIFSPYVGSSVPIEIDEGFKKMVISQTPMGVEAELSEPSRDKFFFSGVERAFGNIGPLSTLEVFGDPEIPLFIIEAMEMGLGYEQAIVKAYENNAEIDYISRLIATGNLGKPQRPMPSRWAKTTVYSVCSRHLIDKVKHLPVMNETSLYHNNYLGNDYVVLAFGKPWQFEIVERWLPDSIWTTGEKEPLYVHEHETYSGVSDQAMREGGSYYSSRLGACELLVREGVQAACLVLFSPRPGSSVPFGSGEMRRGVGGATLVDKFESEAEAVDAACSEIDIPRSTMYKISMMLSQNTLNRWM